MQDCVWASYRPLNSRRQVQVPVAATLVASQSLAAPAPEAQRAVLILLRLTCASRMRVPGRGLPPALLFFSVLVRTTDHYVAGELVLQALRLRCSAVRYAGSHLPFRLIHGGNLTTRSIDLLRRFGWEVEDRSDSRAALKAIYKPVYHLFAARALKRKFIQQPVQRRRDGWATYFKFYAWQATQFDLILMVDLDVCFIGDLDDAVAKLPAGKPFLASPERFDRKYDGLNTHLMALEPSQRTFDELIQRARNGDYIPYTNTEQDVLESHYRPEEVARQPMETLIPHRHLQSPEEYSFTCSEDDLARLLHQGHAPTCDAFWNLCIPRSSMCAPQ